MTFYKTIPTDNATLREYKASASGQDETILNYFKAHQNDSFSPDDLSLLFSANVPITSIRRSCNTLNKGLYIKKTGIMKMGKFGRMTNTYKLVVPETNTQLTLL